MSKRNGREPAPDTAAKALTTQQVDSAIQSVPDGKGGLYSWVNAVLTVQLAHEADEIPVWGTSVYTRDLKLRELVPTEPALAGAMATLAARNAAMGIQLDGPQQTVDAAWELLHGADFGRGIASLITKLSLDLYGQDNGAFIGIAREKFIEADAALKLWQAGKALPPVVGLEHLDAANCIRTGDPMWPVLYRDQEQGAIRQKLLPWHMVVPLAEMPSPIQRVHGIQYSAVTRILKAAQFMRAATIYRREKVEGRQPSSIYVVGGPSNQAITDAMAAAMERADNQGLLRNVEPIIVASLDPTKPVSVERLEWASLPDGFDYDVELKNYITLLALALLEDYQTFAPLPGGNLGTSQQSIVLERKGRGKGPGLWRKIVGHVFNFSGILPTTIEFSFDERDPVAEKEDADLRAAQVEPIVLMVQAGIINAKVAQQMLADDGVLDEEYLAMLGAEDATPDTTRTDEEAPMPTEDIPVLAAPALPALPAPTATPVAPPAPAAASKSASGGGLASRFFRSLETAVWRWVRKARTFTKAPGAIDDIVGEFAAAVEDAVAGYSEGRLTRARAQRVFEAAIAEAWLPAAEAGYEDGGSDVDELEGADYDAIRAAEKAQLEFARDFWAALPDIREAGGDALPRAGLYVSSLKAHYTEWRARGAGNPKLEWRLGATEQHCSDCASLHGTAHSLKWYQDRDLIPRKPGAAMACGGYRCDCSWHDKKGNEYTL